MESSISGSINVHSEPSSSKMTEDKLRELQQIFEDADTDGEGGLDMEKFRIAMRCTMGDRITDHELDMLFMKVDTNCDGGVDWDEYLNYMLLESLEKDSMKILAMQPFSKNVHCCKGEHHDSIRRILHMPSMLRGSTPANGSYVSISQEGTICLWDQNLKLRNTFHLHEVPGVNATDVWVTDGALLNAENILIISTTACQLLIFTFTKFRFELLCCITNLDSSATCLSICTTIDKEVSTNCTYIVWGDMKGTVSVLFMSAPFMETKFAPSSRPNNKIHIAKFTFSEICLNYVENAKGYKFPAIHGDYVQEVAFIPKLHAILSCSKDSRTSLYMGDLDQKMFNNYFRVPKGINSFDYCSDSNTIATGGYDAIIRLWNPYVPSHPVMFLKSHRYPVLHVMFDSDRELVLSISENKEVRVHDLSAQICLQTFYKKTTAWLGSRPVTAALYNQYKGALVMGTTILAHFRDLSEDTNTDELVSHPSPVTNMLYNPLFEQIVSTDEDGMIVVWKFSTGERVIQFRAEQKSSQQGVSPRISTISFDPTFRRLITSTQSGSVKVWNFNNGCCVRELPVFDENLDVCDLLVTRGRMFTAGWNRRITVYMDSYEDDTVYWLKPNHGEDIVSLATYSSVLASASYDGVIFLWSLDTNRLADCLTIDGRTKRDFIVATDRKIPTVGCDQRYSENENRISHIPSCCKVVAPDCRIEKLLFLNARNNDLGTATLLAAHASGVLRAWSIRTSEGLLGSFQGTHTDEEHSIVCLASDPDNTFLITGDACGFIKVWDIRHYHNPSKEDLKILDLRDFPFVQLRQKVKSMKIKSSWLNTYATDSSFPPLLTAFRGHLRAMSAVDYANFNDQEFILSSSLDCSIRLWTIKGEFVALYGQSQLFNPIVKDGNGYSARAANGKEPKPKKSLLPRDIRQCGSSTTLQVVKRHSNWFYVKCLMHGLTCFGIRAKTHARQASENCSSSLKSEDDVVADTPNSASKQSDVLWKNYRRVTRHRPLPNLPAPRQDDINIAVYGCLPCSDLEVVQKVSTPGVILDIKQRRHQEHVTCLVNQRRKTIHRKIGKKN